MKKILSSWLLFNAAFCYAQPAEDYYGPVTISFHGFICNRPTNDDPFGGDGVSDEVSVHFWNWTTVANNRANYNGMSKIYGENFLLPDRIKAGTATINGGIKAGDSYYREAVYGDSEPNILSTYAVITTFCSQNTLIAILPTIWERDKGTLSTTPIQDFGVVTNRAFNDMAIKQKIWDFRNQYTYDDRNPYGFFLAGRHIGLDAKYSGLFTANKNKLASRPIGLFPTWDFSSELIILTPKIIKIISEKDYGYGKGILPVRYNEETLENTTGHGNYILLLRFVSDIKDRNANNPPSNLLSVGVKINNAAAGEEFKFRLQSGARFDSITIRSPNTTANFPTKIAAGQQYYVTQTKGPRNCQLTNYIGIISRDTIVTANCGLPPQNNPQYKIRVSYTSSLMPVNDRYELELNENERIVIDTGHKMVYFSKLFRTGDSYKVKQISFPRTCNLTASNGTERIEQGIIGNQDVSITLNCVSPPLTILKMNITGIEGGETFKFADNYGRTFSFPFSVLANLGGYPVGDPLIIKQTGGPRQCVITYPSTNVPNEPGIVQCDCRNPASTSPIKPKGEFISPPGTKIVLQINNMDTLVLTQPANASDSWLQSMNFNFRKPYLPGTAYSVRIKSEPPNLGCAVYENATGTIEDSIVIRVRCDKTYDLVSRSTDNKILNTYYESFLPGIGGLQQDEGRYVVFGAYGKGMDGSDGKYRQIFWRDRNTGITKLISKASGGEQGNGNSSAPVISADGKKVAFETYATNFGETDNNTTRDVYVWSESSGTVTLVSRSQFGGTSDGESYEPTISGDGTVIAYTSHAKNIVTLQAPFSTPNVYVYNQGSTEFITKDFETGKAAGGYSPSISEDGRKIAFTAYGNRLVANDNNNLWDIFIWQSGMPTLKRISLTSSGGERNQGTESASRVVWPSISGDGQFVAYSTTASNMVGGDNNGMQDIFICNTSGGNVRRISTVAGGDSNGDSPINQGERVGISYNGQWITYNTNATNLGVPKGNIVLQNTQSGKLIAVTSITRGSTARPVLSRNGSYVIAGCSEKYDPRFATSGIFVFYPHK